MSKSNTLHIVQLFPLEMNIYGDNGNAQILSYRARLYGYNVELKAYQTSADEDILRSADIVLGGGGQDSGQRAILDELALAKSTILDLAHDKTPMLMVCGLYQLFGHYFQTSSGEKLAGIGLFDMITKATNQRLIGNIQLDSDQFGGLVGYENHSGITKLANNQASLGRVVMGYGNDETGSHEGAVRYGVVGTYLHGPILAKNPVLADWLLSRAVERKKGDTKLVASNDETAKILKKLNRQIELARQVAYLRPQ